MACVLPFKIRNKNYSHDFPQYNPCNPNQYYWNKQYFEVPCNWCLNCRIDRRNFLTECGEYLYYKKYNCQGCFVTLTYDNFELVYRGYLKTNPYTHEVNATLNYNDFRRFIGALRYRINKMHSDTDKKILKSKGVYLSYKELQRQKKWLERVLPKNWSYIYSGEYGDSFIDRPHFHCALIGLDNNFAEKIITDIWHKQHSNSIVDCGYLDKGGIPYIIKYIDKQLHGDLAQQAYTDKGIEMPKSAHSLNYCSQVIFDRVDEIKANNYCLTTRHNNLIPIPTYYMKFFGVHRNVDYAHTIDSLFNCTNIKYNPTKDIFSFKAFNKAKQKQSLIKYKNRLVQARLHGESVDDVLFLEQLIKDKEQKLNEIEFPKTSFSCNDFKKPIPQWLDDYICILQARSYDSLDTIPF